MNSLKTLAGGGFALMLTFAAPAAWSQSVPKNIAPSGTTGAYDASWSTQGNASLMDQTVTREIRQAWSEGKDATLAMAFQENAEIAMSDGRENDATHYFQAAEQELGSLNPGRPSY
jgi:hypothetical protein